MAFRSGDTPRAPFRALSKEFHFGLKFFVSRHKQVLTSFIAVQNQSRHMSSNILIGLHMDLMFRAEMMSPETMTT